LPDRDERTLSPAAPVKTGLITFPDCKTLVTPGAIVTVPLVRIIKGTVSLMINRGIDCDRIDILLSDHRHAGRETHLV
jgi:hypothetical protein